MGTHNGETTISTFELFPSEDHAIEYFEILRWYGCVWLAPIIGPRKGKNKVHPDGYGRF